MANLCLVFLAVLFYGNLLIFAIGGLFEKPGNERLTAASTGVLISMMVLIGLFYFFMHPKVRGQFK